MSSYIVDAKVINSIVSGKKYGCKYNRNYPNSARISELLNISNPQDAAGVAQDLFDMNVEAVRQRYPDCIDLDPSQMPGPGEDWTGFNEDMYNSRIKVYRYLGEFIYQCSEGNVPETTLFKLVEEFYNRLAHMLVRSQLEQSAN